MNKSTVVLTTTEERQAMPGNSDKKPSKKKKQANNNQYQFLDELEIREANKNKENKKKASHLLACKLWGISPVKASIAPVLKSPRGAVSNCHNVLSGHLLRPYLSMMPTATCHVRARWSAETSFQPSLYNFSFENQFAPKNSIYRTVRYNLNGHISNLIVVFFSLQVEHCVKLFECTFFKDFKKIYRYIYLSRIQS